MSSRRLIASLHATFRRETKSVGEQLLAYADERDAWRLVPGITNSSATLALHLAGNLRHFIGDQIGDIAYVRDRAAEFARRDVPREAILAELQGAEQAIDHAFARLTPSDLDATYPLRLAGVELTTGAFLLHLHAHLAYHLGQIDYHRRIVTGQPDKVDVLAIPALIAGAG